jgi:hypothetical protein
MKKVIKLFIFSIFISSCGESEKPIAPDFGYDYAPLEVGSYFIYQIDSIYYDDFANTIDTFRFQLKEVIDSAYTLLDGQQGYRLERFKRSSPSLNWRISDVWFVYRTNQQLVRVEENQPIVKLVFPVKLRSEWNINAQNTFDSTVAEITEIVTNYTLNQLVLPQSATVTVQDEENLIERKLNTEIYTRGIGLSAAYFKDLRTQVTGQIVRGIDYRKELIEYGME